MHHNVLSLILLSLEGGLEYSVYLLQQYVSPSFKGSTLEQLNKHNPCPFGQSFDAILSFVLGSKAWFDAAALLCSMRAFTWKRSSWTSSK